MAQPTSNITDQFTLPEAPEAKLPFTKKPYFFSITERKFFIVLQEIAAKNNLYVFSKVRFEDLLDLPHKMPFSHRAHFRGKVRARHIDFVLCDNKFFQPRLVIELDDWHHRFGKQPDIDDYKDQVLKDAGLPILRISVSHCYDPQHLEGQIQAKIFNKY